MAPNVHDGESVSLYKRTIKAAAVDLYDILVAYGSVEQRGASRILRRQRTPCLAPWTLRRLPSNRLCVFHSETDHGPQATSVFGWMGDYSL